MLKSFAILPVNTPTNDNLTHSESRVSDVSMCCRPFRSIFTTVKVHFKQTCHCVNSIEICISNVYTHFFSLKYLYTWRGLMYFLLPIMFIDYNSEVGR